MREHASLLFAVDLTSVSDGGKAAAAQIAEISDGRFWNFIPGIFVVRTALVREQIENMLDKLDSATRFIVVPIGGAGVFGRVPEQGWDSWFFELFADQAKEIATVQGWSETDLLEVIADYNKAERDQDA